jgi:hypothetical protein
MIEKYFCERCGKKLNPKTMVWLELDNTTGRYTDQPLPEDHVSQGGFTFGRDCAAVAGRENDEFLTKEEKGKPCS